MNKPRIRLIHIGKESATNYNVTTLLQQLGVYPNFFMGDTVGFVARDEKGIIDGFYYAVMR